MESKKGGIDMDFGKDCNVGFDDSFMFWSFVWSVK